MKFLIIYTSPTPRFVPSEKWPQRYFFSLRREVQRQEFERYKPPWKRNVVTQYLTQYFLTACIVLVILSIVIYLTRLQKIFRRDLPLARSSSGALLSMMDPPQVVIKTDSFSWTWCRYVIDSRRYKEDKLQNRISWTSDDVKKRVRPCTLKLGRENN